MSSPAELHKRFFDIVPSRPMTRFFSIGNSTFISLIYEAHRLGVLAFVVLVASAVHASAIVRMATRDGRMCTLQGKIVVECVAEGLFEVESLKVNGDPLECRPFFKVAVL